MTGKASRLNLECVVWGKRKGPLGRGPRVKAQAGDGKTKRVVRGVWGRQTTGEGAGESPDLESVF